MKNATSAIANLKRAVEAKGVSNDTYTLQKWFSKHSEEENGQEVATFTLIGIESKYVPSYDKADEGGSLGYRTRFVTKDHGTIGTFSNGAHRFFETIAEMMERNPAERYLSMAFEGTVIVKVSEVDLGKGKSTYNFEIVEEGSTLKGISEIYQLTDGKILLIENAESRTAVDGETGEVQDNAPKPKKDSKSEKDVRKETAKETEAE